MSTGFESKIEGGFPREITHLEWYVFYVNSIAPLGINASRKGVKRLEKKADPDANCISARHSGNI